MPRYGSIIPLALCCSTVYDAPPPQVIRRGWPPVALNAVDKSAANWAKKVAIAKILFSTAVAFGAPMLLPANIAVILTTAQTVMAVGVMGYAACNVAAAWMSGDPAWQNGGCTGVRVLGSLSTTAPIDEIREMGRVASAGRDGAARELGFRAAVANKARETIADMDDGKSVARCGP
jgi:hypothetical protein